MLRHRARRTRSRAVFGLTDMGITPDSGRTTAHDNHHTTYRPRPQSRSPPWHSHSHCRGLTHGHTATATAPRPRFHGHCSTAPIHARAEGAPTHAHVHSVPQPLLPLSPSRLYTRAHAHTGATTTELLRVHPEGCGDRTIYATDVVDLDQRGHRSRARRAQHDEVVSGEVCLRVCRQACG